MSLFVAIGSLVYCLLTSSSEYYAVSLNTKPPIWYSGGCYLNTSSFTGGGEMEGRDERGDEREGDERWEKRE